jgi:DNA-binding PadR family transcriptional regulator
MIGENSKMWDDWRDKWDNWRNIHEKIDKLNKLGGLRVWILHVLDHGPKNGVEVMDAIQEHYDIVNDMYQKRRQQFGGDHYGHHFQKTMRRVPCRPSPGSVYPMLKKMVDEGLIEKIEDGKYDLTEEGRETIFDLFGGLRGPEGQRMDRGTFVVENVLREISSYVVFLEDIKKEKLAPHKEIIGELSERLKKMEESLPDE